MRYPIALLVFIICFSCKKKVTPVATHSENPVIETTLPSPTQGKAHLPRLKAQNNKLYMTWVEETDAFATLKYAIWEHKKWTPPQALTSGKDWFINWADFPALGVNDGKILTNILQKSTKGTYDYDIKLQLSQQDQVIKKDFLLHNDGIAAEHGFVSMQAMANGYYVSWLDGRNTKNEDASKNQMTLRNAFIDWQSTITQDTEIDHRVCDCCNTATAITSNGPVVAYRDRVGQDDEIRDIAIVRKVNGQWTTPIPVYRDNWKINGCPVNGPAIAALDNTLIVAWFTAADEEPKVQLSFSNDSGASFAPPVRINLGDAIGRVDTALLPDGSALVVWMESQGKDTVVQLRRVFTSGILEEPITISKIQPERASGFPQLEIIGTTAYLAWTIAEDHRQTIALKAIAF